MNFNSTRKIKALKAVAWPAWRGKDVRLFRKVKEITIEDLALLLGINPVTISRWENQAEDLIPPIARVAMTAVFKNWLLLEKALIIKKCGFVITKERIKALREHLKMDRKQFAQLLNVSLSSVTKWEAGTVIPSGTANQLLLRLEFNPKKYLRLIQECDNCDVND